jgi:hypothetical protein
MREGGMLIVWEDTIMCFNRLQNRESGVSMEGHLSDSECQRVFIGTSKRIGHFAKWSECETVSSDECLLIFLSDVLTNSMTCNSGSWLDLRELGKRLGSFLSSTRKCIRPKKHMQLVKLSTRNQTRRVKLYSIESQNQVDFCCLIYFSFMTAVLEKQIQKECDLRNRALPPFVSDCTPCNGSKKPWHPLPISLHDQSARKTLHLRQTAHIEDSSDIVFVPRDLLVEKCWSQFRRFAPVR